MSIILTQYVKVKGELFAKDNHSTTMNPVQNIERDSAEWVTIYGENPDGETLQIVVHQSVIERLKGI